MRLSRRLILDGRKMHTETVTDVEPTLDRAAMLKSMPENVFEKVMDAWHVGSIPLVLYHQWLREAGVSPADHAAADEVLRKKLLSGEVAKFRVREGTF